MHRAITSWYSHRTGLEMPIIRYGSWGPALVLIPTWQADFLEAEQRGLIHALAPHIEAGRVSVFSVNTITPWSWCAPDGVPMHERAARSAAYSAYLDDEVVPFVRGELRDGGARLAIGGASFGTFFAADALFRRPDLYHALIGMSGMYQLGGWLHGYSDDNVYFHSPAWYVPNLEGPTLNRIRGDTRIHLLCGRGAWEEPWETEAFAATLRHKGIPHWLDMWGHDVPHDWPTWQRMLDIVVNERMGW